MLSSGPVGFNTSNHAVRFAWQELLSRVRWDYFITLTVNPRWFPRMGAESWAKAWTWFLFTWLSESAVAAGQGEKVPSTIKTVRVKKGGEWVDEPVMRVKGPWANAWRKGRGKPMWVLALEPHRDSRLHAHVLVKMTRDLAWLDYSVGQKIWQAHRGICWFEVPKSQVEVGAYVTKYVVKSGSDALIFSENFDAARITGC